MANQKNASTYGQTQGFFSKIDWGTVTVAAGLALLAPYVYRRFSPVFGRQLDNIGAADMVGSVKDKALEVADRVGLGGSAQSDIDTTLKNNPISH